MSTFQNISELVTCKIKHWNISTTFCKCFISHVTTAKVSEAHGRHLVTDSRRLIRQAAVLSRNSLAWMCLYVRDGPSVGLPVAVYIGVRLYTNYVLILFVMFDWLCWQVRQILSRCTCPNQYPMIRVSEGKYRVGDNLTLIFVRVSIQPVNVVFI